MYRKLAIVSALCACLSVMGWGCTKAAPAKSSVPGTTAVPHGEAENAPTWKLTLQSTCKSGDATACVGSYGFTVEENGHYQVGPGPQGQTVAGTISPDELKGLNVALSTATAQVKLDAVTSDTCTPLTAPPAAPADSDSANATSTAADDSDAAVVPDDLINLTLDTQTYEIVKVSKDAGLCFKTDNAQDAQALHGAMLDLAKTYYKLPFPDACADSVSALETLFGTLKSCSSDADCSYVSDGFSPVVGADAQTIVADDCSVLKPLIVGNATAVAGATDKLQEGLSNVQDVCGQKMLRDSCTEISTFSSSAGAPVCHQGQCQVNPAAGAF